MTEHKYGDLRIQEDQGVYIVERYEEFTSWEVVFHGPTMQRAITYIKTVSEPKPITAYHQPPIYEATND